MFPLSRHQLAAYSPLSARAILAAVGTRALHGPEELGRVRALLAAEFAAETAVFVDSGRSALRLAISLALPKAHPRRIVALPAFQCFEVATAAVGAECDIALYDIDPATLGPDLESLEHALRLGARAIVIAPLYGLPVDWDRIVALTLKYGAVAIEDAAQATGGEWKGRRLGSLGQTSVVSFGRGKGWTGGGGGALLLRGEDANGLMEMHAQLSDPGASRELRVAAVTALQLMFGRASLYGVPAAIPGLGLGETRYHDPTPPRQGSSFSAALIRRTIHAVQREAMIRRENAAFWNTSLPPDLVRGIPTVLPQGTAGYLRFPLRLTAEAAQLASAQTARRAGVARSFPRPLGELPAVAARLVEQRAKFPGADSLARELVTLPTHSLLTDRDRDAIIALSASWAASGSLANGPRELNGSR